MKKRMILILSLALALVLGCILTVSADDDYTYRVTIYAGQQGHFTEGAKSGGKIWEREYKPGEQVDVSLSDLGFVQDNDKYYVRGLRITGHDNDETTGVQNLSYEVNEDASYEIAYGIKGALVSYTVKYVDTDGNELRSSDVYYGMPNDKPVVSYRYIDGYIPNAYTQGKKLTTAEDENVFTFVYTALTPDAVQVIQTGQGGNRGAGAPGTAMNPAGTAVPGAAVIAGGDGAGTTDIADGSTPLANGPSQYVDLDGSNTPGAGGLFGGHALAFALLGAALLVLLTIVVFLKRRDEEDEEEEVTL